MLICHKGRTKYIYIYIYLCLCRNDEVCEMWKVFSVVKLKRNGEYHAWYCWKWSGKFDCNKSMLKKIDDGEMLHNDDDYCIAYSFNWLLQDWHLVFGMIVLAFLALNGCIGFSEILHVINIGLGIENFIKNEWCGTKSWKCLGGKYVGKSG